jgi:hypothetical protein
VSPVGELLQFRSPVDGLLHPCAVCATDGSLEAKPRIVEVSPGAISDLPGAVALTEEIAGIAAAAGRSCVVLRLTGRGPGSVYQNYDYLVYAGGETLDWGFWGNDWRSQDDDGQAPATSAPRG